MPDFRENVSLRNLITFHIDANARYYIKISTLGELQELIASGFLHKHPFLLLGGGSNILFTKDFEGLVIHIQNKGIEVQPTDNTTVFVKCAAGENWSDFVTFCVQRGFGGLENLSLIPGNVGSCPIQNIGAYGVEVKNSLISVEAIDLSTGKFRVFTNQECGFGYRDSIFKRELKGKVAIWSVTFSLNLCPSIHIEYGAITTELQLLGIVNPCIADISKAVTRIRQSKLPDPEILGNAGSFFKNPVVSLEFAENLKKEFPGIVFFSQADGNAKLAAGWLIEHCGLKGFREGDAGVHQNQALVLVNYGKATGNDILDLAKNIQQSVNQHFGVYLEIEVNIV